MAFDPSTHFVYFIPIENKTAREVASNYMEHVILEQGMNTSILTDNGTEFRNAKMKEIMRLLETEHQIEYTPSGALRGSSPLYFRYQKSTIAMDSKLSDQT